VALHEKTIDPETGESLTPLVVNQGDGYYQYIQGTSMAAPHAVGVAAAIIGKWGTVGPDGDLRMDPAAVEAQLRATATDTACPTPRMFTYPDLNGDFNAKCAGTSELNGFYGDGIVNAFKAVTVPPLS
jgi:subtilisin family serine protease